MGRTSGKEQKLDGMRNAQQAEEPRKTWQITQVYSKRKDGGRPAELENQDETEVQQ